MRLVVVVQAPNEVFDVLVGLGLGNEFFGGGAPDHDQAVTVVFLFEAPDIVPDGLHGCEPGAGNLGVAPLDALNVVLAEYRRHRRDRVEKVGHRLDLLVAVENPALDGSLVCVIGNGVPRAED